MAIIKQHNKRSGITYAYESHSYWDPQKKMTRAKRKLIGRVDPDTGEADAGKFVLRKEIARLEQRVLEVERQREHWAGCGIKTMNYTK